MKIYPSRAAMRHNACEDRHEFVRDEIALQVLMSPPSAMKTLLPIVA
jgi:hypothetical protein